MVNDYAGVLFTNRIMKKENMNHLKYITAVVIGASLFSMGLNLYSPGILSTVYASQKITESTTIQDQDIYTQQSAGELFSFTLAQALQTLTGQITSLQNDPVSPKLLQIPVPVARLNDEVGDMSYRWLHECTPVSETSVLITCDCYFDRFRLQQKIFYLAEAPYYTPREVFRQDSRSFQETMKHPEFLEMRLPCPLPADGGYIYEVDGMLYYLTEDFKESTSICNLRNLMGDQYDFTVRWADENQCDVTTNASRMLACTDEGLLEYNLKTKEKNLLEAAYLVPHKDLSVDGDCSCGEPDYDFTGPLKAEYAPDDHGYAFTTGTEYGAPTGITFRSSDGETLYSKEGIESFGGFEWLETENASYFCAFYREKEETWMDRVNIATGEEETFKVPDDVFFGDLYVGFLTEDLLLCCNSKNEMTYGIYDLRSGRYLTPDVNANHADRHIMVLGSGCWKAKVLQYPVIKSYR